ncbi:MAG TPA: site-specific integrase [Candidatus Pacearchaeota archaeon]|mgnify:FL=1|nr:site-specific integrase [Candidatus Pacearchaeota archaeon]HPJ87102.1 site-specific integrase [Candidatus Pacearchaeota archaeon]
MKVHIRQRKQSKAGSISLFLEIYKGTTTTPEGKVKNLRDYEYLNLYLIDKPKTPIEKQGNKDTLQLAESIRAKRELEIKNGLYGFTNEFKQSTNFIDYFTDQMEKRKQSKGNYGNWNSTLKHLIKFAGTKVLFREIDQTFCENFRDYLKNTATTKSGQPLSSSTVSSYFNKFRACLKEAVRKKIILSNPAIDVVNVRVIENKREYLTIDELKAIVKAECRYDVLKRAFLFSCLTGLRWSDVNNLKWSELQNTNEGWRITFNQQKTKGLQYLDISEQARGYLGEQGNPDERVFIGLKYSSYMNVELTKWMMRAGITKDITFHCARHTFAVLQLTLGTEIYTLSKLLGHSELKTTQIYAKIVDEKKREAVNKIPDINI